MKKKTNNDDTILISQKEIIQRLQKIAKQIVLQYDTEPLILVGILKGGCLVTSDLLRVLHEIGMKNIQLEFIKVSSYGKRTESSGNPTVAEYVPFNPEGKHVLLVDDIIDTGKSLQLLHGYFVKKAAKTVKSFALLSKPDRRSVKYEADYIGFIIPNVWVEGYGMDSDEKGRGNPNIIVKSNSKE